ncbi:substrate-binding periplasmic protein [Paucibacter sp. Y2R2-4]|uniref:substrate-binding periplasmic protein n=1 Tax=Paucibacter sp. Y2R2-4 TaxID=2893553 RepID=UPI0021E45FE9|nr:transporter substrate-binding domain-containing protein [Paucibacter sp. Y2R2-4]MCV2351534.1 transporter substrate-binding domain-containing protein [Paucibacter sp. Y2R2-4]
MSWLQSAALVLLSACAFTCTGAWAQSSSATDAGATVHLVTETSPYVYAEGGKVAGPATEILERVMSASGVEAYDIKLYPWARAYDLALKQANVLIYLIARTPERESRFKWVGEMLRLEFDFYRLKSRQDIQLQRFGDAQAYRIGVSRDDFRHQFLSRKGFTKLLVEPQSLDNFRQLLSQRVDLVVMTETDVNSYCKQLSVDCAQVERVHRIEELSSTLYAAFSLSTPDETVERVRRGFEKVKASGKAKL